MKHIKTFEGYEPKFKVGDFVKIIYYGLPKRFSESWGLFRIEKVDLKYNYGYGYIKYEYQIRKVETPMNQP